MVGIAGMGVGRTGRVGREIERVALNSDERGKVDSVDAMRKRPATGVHDQRTTELNGTARGGRGRTKGRYDTLQNRSIARDTRKRTRKIRAHIFVVCPSKRGETGFIGRETVTEGIKGIVVRRYT